MAFSLLYGITVMNELSRRLIGRAHNGRRTMNELVVTDFNDMLYLPQNILSTSSMRNNQESTVQHTVSILLELSARQSDSDSREAKSDKTAS